MYLHCKYGFIEADRWDGQRIPKPSHMRAVRKLGDEPVIVLRSREEATLNILVGTLDRDCRVFMSPPGWDYQFRAYVTAGEWGQIMATVAADLDYRNFKSWTHSQDPSQSRLAHAIWHAAHEFSGHFHSELRAAFDRLSHADFAK